VIGYVPSDRRACHGRRAPWNTWISLTPPKRLTIEVKLVIQSDVQMHSQRGGVFVWPGACFAGSSHRHRSPLWRLRGDPRCVGVVTKSPRSNQEPLAGGTANEPEKRCVLILGNALVHDRAAIALMVDAGVLMRLLPPYSPDFIPIENLFSVRNSWLQRRVTPKQVSEKPFLSIAVMLS